MKKDIIIDALLVVMVIAYNLVLTSASFLWLFTGYFDSVKSILFSQAVELSAVQQKLFAFFTAGILGGSFYTLRSLYQRLAEAYSPIGIKRAEDLPDPKMIFNIRVWFFWYLYRPLQAGILSIVVICLFSSGFLTIGNTTDGSLSQLFFQVSLGFMIGFGTHEVINKIEELIKVLFARSKNEREQSVLSKTEMKIQENQSFRP